MSTLARKKRVPRRKDRPASIGRDNRIKREPSEPAKNPKRDSEDIERAVYDGMQDLRAEKPGT
jgi:hypothetical protein